MNFIINGEVIRKDKEEKMMYYSNLFIKALSKGELKNANKNFYQIWLIDSADVDTKYKEGLLLLKESRYDEAIARFDEALRMEPYMREALLNRGIARLKKYQSLRNNAYTKPGIEIPYNVDDFLAMPEGEKDKICSDLQKAHEMSYGEFHIPALVSRAVMNHCGIKIFY